MAHRTVKKKKTVRTDMSRPAPVVVVGIGTSAGGLESLETFLRNVPKDSGVAFAVVQHLDPDRKGMLPDLLQRVTTMTVAQIDDLAPVQADCVYIIPPNKSLTLSRGFFHLSEPVERRGLRLPIDKFFESLAHGLPGSAIGVVLSGMGTDGTLGLCAIRTSGGKAYVQDPDTAKFDSMPRSAIASGNADVVATLEKLPAHILSHVRSLTSSSSEAQDDEDTDHVSFRRVNAFLRAQTGHDFSLYKKSTLHRRMRRRMAVHKIETLGEYADYVRDNSQEATLLFNECLIGVTGFFRDAQSWEKLAEQMLEQLRRVPPDTLQMRAWVAGCSTGEEAYSLAIVFKEVVEQIQPSGLSLQIFATDIDANAVNKARLGFFPTAALADVSDKRRNRFFREEKDGFRATAEIREMIIFAPQTVSTDPPFTKLDILCCRNLLIYFSVQLQEHLIQVFHYSLKMSGILFLGSSETVGSFSNLFVPVDNSLRLYRRRATDQTLDVFALPQSLIRADSSSSEGHLKAKTPVSSPATLQSLANRLILREYCPTTILASPQGAVLYTSGRPGKFLEPASGAANWNVFVMARDGLRHELYAAFAKTQRNQRPVEIAGLRLDLEDRPVRVNVSVRTLSEPDTLRGLVLVVIAEVAESLDKRRRPRKNQVPPGQVTDLQHELALSRETISTMQSAAQMSQEEYRSANEELQSANEELQSANEEMVTSKEEMQSLNEELHSVNQELEQRILDLATANSDMNNLLDNTAVASLFLDTNLSIRRYTPGATNLIKLIPSDVGRPFTDIATDFDYPDLSDDTRRTMRTLVPHEKRVAGRSGGKFLVRIDCYRTVQNKVDGVIITFTDITAEERLVAELAQLKDLSTSMAAGLGILSWVYRADGSCDSLGQQWLHYTGLPETEQLAHGWLRQVHEEDRGSIIEQAARAHGSAPISYTFRVRRHDGVYLPFNACCIPEFNTVGVLLKWSCWAVQS